MPTEFGNPHTEGFLLGVLDGVFEEGEEFRAGFAEAGAVLGGCVDGDVEDLGGAEHLFRGCYSGSGR